MIRVKRDFGSQSAAKPQCTADTCWRHKSRLLSGKLRPFSCHGIAVKNNEGQEVIAKGRLNNCERNWTTILLA